MSTDDTIYACATGAVAAPVAILRLSGPAAHQIAGALFDGPRPPDRRLSLRRLRDPASGEAVDEALVVMSAAPQTATGEPTAELHVHGGAAVVSAVSRLLEGAGARPAAPGEFSRRALLNGRADLTRLEAVAALVEAETDAQRRAAMRHLSGAVGDAVAQWRAAVIGLMAQANAALDFSDQDLPEGEQAAVRDGAAALAAALRAAATGAAQAARLRRGVEVAVVGPPNVGKSSLLNRIAGRDVALTSPWPGTTRDVIEVRCELGGRLVTLLDTAGLRDSDDPVEQAGVAWGARRAASADCVLAVSAPDGAAERPGAALHVWNKCDVAPPPADFHGAAVSARTGEGLDDLMARLLEATGGPARETGLLVNARQAAALSAAANALDRADGSELELSAEALREAAAHLDAVIGRVDSEDVLDDIFGRFCIGK